MTYGHLQADCLYTGISSGPNARYRVWEAFTFTFFANLMVGRQWLPGFVLAVSVNVRAGSFLTRDCATSVLLADTQSEMIR